jgi:hypothetical protein
VGDSTPLNGGTLGLHVGSGVGQRSAPVLSVDVLALRPSQRSADHLLWCFELAPYITSGLSDINHCLASRSRGT